MNEYNPAQARQLAARLRSRASVSTLVSTLLGIAIGTVSSPFLLQSLPGNLSVNLPGWLCTVVFGVLGFMQGLERGFQLRLQAQTLLCQVQIEENTRARNPELTGNPSGVNPHG